MYRFPFISAFVILLGLHVIIVPAQSPETINPSVLGLRSHLGFVIIHSRDIRPMKNTYPFGIGIDLKKRYTSRKTWETYGCYPMIGFSFTYWNFNNPEILGQGMSALFFVEPFFGFRRKVNVSLRAGLGLAYLGNPYDEVENPQNLSFSSHLGFPLLLSINLNYQLNPELNLNIGACYNHISNGGVKYPNKGINYPSVAFGLDYYIKPVKYQEFPKMDWRDDTLSRKRHDVFIFLALTGIEADEKAQYVVFGVALNFSYRVARISAMNAGFEWVVDESLKKRIERDSLDVDYQRGSLLFGHEFLLGRFVFSQQLGVYLYDPYHRNDPVYQRYGLNFKVSKKFFIGINLKAHRHIADFMDLRFGVSF